MNEGNAVAFDMGQRDRKSSVYVALEHYQDGRSVRQTLNSPRHRNFR